MKFSLSLFGGLLLLSAAVQSEPSEEALRAHQQAGVSLMGLIEAATDADALKRSDFRDLVQILADEERVLKSGSYSQAEFEPLSNICTSVNRASVSMLLIGLKAQNIQSLPQAEAQNRIQSLMMSNVKAFQDELAQLQPFLLRCMAKLIGPTTELLASLDADELNIHRRNGLAQMRQGLLGVYGMAIETACDESLGDAFKHAMLSALNDTSREFVTAIPLADRNRLRESLAKAIATGREIHRPQLIALEKIFQNDQCVGLCAVQ